MSIHAAFLLGKALAAVRTTDTATFDRLLADVEPTDMPAVLRGIEDSRKGPCATDMALLLEAVRT